LLFATCFFQLFTTVPLFYKDGLHINEFWIGVIMSSNGLVIALFEMVIVYKLEGKRPYLIFMFYGAICMALSFFILNIPFPSGFVIAFLSMFVLTIAEMISMPFMNSYYIARSNERSRGQYAAMYTIAWSAAQVIGSSSGSVIAGNIGFTALWFITGAVSLLTAGGYYMMQKR